ncbi:PT domain-containing protein, partial [Myxococcota bacterium]|nr:PT domain-containing protein [Myxococcota bacterium]
MLERLKRHAKVIGGAVALWFILLLSGGLFLSQIDARDGLNVFGPEVWVAGEPAALRVARRDLRFNRLMPLSKLNARFISPSGEVGPAVALEGRANGFVQGLLTPPSRAGRWKIALTGEIEDGPITAELGVDVLPSPPLTPIEPLSKQPPVYPPDVGALRVALTPMGPLLAAGLPDSLALRITDAQGQPRRALVEFGLKEGASAIPLPRRLLTGAHGLARMNIHPLHPRFWFTFTVLDPEAPLSAPSSQPTSAPSSQPTSAP